VRLDSGDALPNDDGYLFAVERSDPERVLFVHGSGDTRSPLYFGNALDAAAESAFALQSVSLDQAANLPLAKYAFVVLSNLAALPASFESDLQRYVRDGGSVFITLGTSAAGRSRVPLFSEPIQGVRDYSLARGRERYLSVGETDPTHASIGKNGNLSGLKVFYAVGVDAANSHVVARLTDGTPLLLDKKIGEGRVLLFTSGLDNLTNDFPLLPSFVPFVEQTSRDLSGTERRVGARVVDSFVDLRTTQQTEPGRNLGIEVIDPQGHRPLSLNEAAAAQSFRLTQAGFYQIRLANGRQEVVGVNPDRRESNLDVMPDDVLALWRGSPHETTQTSQLARNISEREEPYGLWWYIMAVVLVAALAESWMGSYYLGTPREES
jgi:hypothetical protein